MDKDYEDEEKRFKKCVSFCITAGCIERLIDDINSYEAKIESLHKEAKGYLDSVRGTAPRLCSRICQRLKLYALVAMTMAQARISETVDQFYDETAPMATAGRKYKDSMTTMDANARTQLVCSVQECVV